MQTCAVATQHLAKMLEQFLGHSPQAIAVEDGELIFDFAVGRYSVVGDGKCVLHLWSEDRNIVRRVLDAEISGRALRMSVLRFGQIEPKTLEICPDRDRRAVAAQRSIRLRYQRLLERVLARDFAPAKLQRVSSKPDLQRSLSSVYTRALLRNGQSAFAILGVNAEETQASVDATLTFGILWMDYQRNQLAGRAHVEGLKLFVPPGRSEILRQRMAHLDAGAAKWQIYELDERSEILESIDGADTGNVLTRLLRAVDVNAAKRRFAASVARIRALAPAAEITVDSPSEIVFRLYGLEFARARIVPAPGSFRSTESIVFGLGSAEYLLDHGSDKLFRELVCRIVAHRHSGGSHSDLFFRMCPERWLEALVTRDVRAIDERLDGQFVYTQVPAFAASDRAMLDVLTCTLDGRLAVLELKANEDIHLPLQGLDYWARVTWHQERGEFSRYGYFAGRELSNASPLLYLVAPALRTHPATDTVLRYLSPRIDWALAQVDERWRNGVRVVNRKHAKAKAPSDHTDFI